jgi:Flp pilus assembly protein TadD
VPVAFGEGLGLAAEAAAAYQRGVQLREAGKLDEAASAFTESARLAPASAAPLNELGIVQRQRGDFAAAADAYTRALAIDAQYAPALRNLGILRDLYQDDPAAAVELFEKYKAVTSEDRPVTSWIADVKQRAARRAPAPAAAAPTEAQ